MEYPSFQEMVVTSLNKVDVELRNQLYSSIYLSGGNTYFKGIQEKLHTEIKKLSPKRMRPKLYLPNNRKYSCWIGGNVISTLEVFKRMWITKHEWSDKGKKLIHSKTI